MGKKVRDPEAAMWHERLKGEAEEEDFDRFAAAYRRATGISLEVEERPDPPDFVCIRDDGGIVGVELTQIRRSPDGAMWDRILDKQDDMRAWDAYAEFERLLYQKAAKLPKFPTRENILVVLSCEAEFAGLLFYLKDMPLSEFEQTGFQEIWVGDYQGVREGAHRHIQLFGLYPAHLRELTPRPDSDWKPYG